MSNEQSVSQRQQTIYNRTIERIIPDKPLQSQLSMRPVTTKNTYFPMLNPKTNNSIRQYQTFDTNVNFNPGNTKGPWSGFASNINTESIVRNQIYASQKNPLSAYIPSSNSSLYVNKWKNTNTVEQPFHNLFNGDKVNDIVSTNPNDKYVGISLFNNSTRQQLKDID